MVVILLSLDVIYLVYGGISLRIVRNLFDLSFLVNVVNYQTYQNSRQNSEDYSQSYDNPCIGIEFLLFILLFVFSCDFFLLFNGYNVIFKEEGFFSVNDSGFFHDDYLVLNSHYFGNNNVQIIGIYTVYNLLS